jgi:hypothetical protein
MKYSGIDLHSNNSVVTVSNFSKTPGMRKALGWRRSDALTRRAPV